MIFSKFIMNPPYLSNIYIDFLKYALEHAFSIVSLNPNTFLKFVDENNIDLYKYIKNVSSLEWKESINDFENRIPLDACIVEFHNIESDEYKKHIKSFYLNEEIDVKLLKNIKSFPTFSSVVKKKTPLKNYSITYSYITGLGNANNGIYKDDVFLNNGKRYIENVKNQHKKEYPKTHLEFETFEKAENFLKFLNSRLFKYIEYLTKSGHYVCISKLPYIDFEEDFDEYKCGELFGLSKEEVNIIQNTYIPKVQE